MRPFKDDDPYFSSMRARNSPPDFLPSYQTGLKKTIQQPNDGRPRRIVQKNPRLISDGEVRMKKALYYLKWFSDEKSLLVFLHNLKDIIVISNCAKFHPKIR